MIWRDDNQSIEEAHRAPTSPTFTSNKPLRPSPLAANKTKPYWKQMLVLKRPLQELQSTFQNNITTQYIKDSKFSNDRQTEVNNTAMSANRQKFDQSQFYGKSIEHKPPHKKLTVNMRSTLFHVRKLICRCFERRGREGVTKRDLGGSNSVKQKIIAWFLLMLGYLGYQVVRLPITDVIWER